MSPRLLPAAVILISACGRSSSPSASGTGGTAAAGGGSGIGGAGTGAAGGSGSSTGGSKETGGNGDSGASAGNGASAGTAAAGGESATAGGAAGSGGSAGSSASGGMTASGGDDAGGQGGEGTPDPNPIGAPSCEGLAGNECAGHDCCESPIVPSGTVTVDGKEIELPSFRLDRFEVTVARFRKFMLAQKAWTLAGNPLEGAGAHPLVPESGYDRGWIGRLDSFIVEGLEPMWVHFVPGTAEMPNTGGGFLGNPTYPIAGTDWLAVNWVQMHVAFAFCIWDGGRLPAAAEWKFAIHRGDEQTKYPWGDAPPSAEMFASVPPPTAAPYENDVFWKYHGIPVGSHPASRGRFGQDDLAAGLSEYLRDTLPEAPASPEGGLIELAEDQVLQTHGRAIAYASWETPGGDAVSRADGIGGPNIGFRCARDLPR